MENEMTTVFFAGAVTLSIICLLAWAISIVYHKIAGIRAEETMRRRRVNHRLDTIESRMLQAATNFKSLIEAHPELITDCDKCGKFTYGPGSEIFATGNSATCCLDHGQKICAYFKEKPPAEDKEETRPGCEACFNDIDARLTAMEEQEKEEPCQKNRPPEK